MVIKKMKLRKSENTMTGLVISLLLVMGIFLASWTIITENADDAGIGVDDKYNASYGNLTDAQSDLDDNVNTIRDSFDDIKEADSTFEVAWNGLKGLGATLKLPINFVDTAISTWTALIFPLDFIPSWVLSLVFIGFLAFVVFLVLKILKGEPNM